MKNLKGLRAFTRIMTLGTLEAAARDMHISQSALSRQLALFEHEMGLTLFTRENRRLMPTEEGKAFYTEAQRILHSLEQIPKIASEIKAKPKPRLRVVATHRVAAAIVAPAIDQYVKEDPSARVSLEVHPVRFLEQWIAANEFDLGISSLPSHHDDIVTETICHAPAVAVFAPDHSLANHTSITLEELKDEVFILPSSGTVMREKIDDLFAISGFTPAHVPIQVSQILMACVLVTRGAGVTLCDALMPVIFGDALRAIPIEPRYNLEFGLLFPKGIQASPNTQRLAQIIREQAAKVTDQ